jgi:hypothetical protein
MSRARVPFKQADVTRVLKAAANAGIKVARFELDPAGKIVVFSGEQAPNGEVTPLAEWRAGRGSR